jgi:hypothetical protein
VDGRLGRKRAGPTTEVPRGAERLVKELTRRGLGEGAVRAAVALACELDRAAPSEEGDRWGPAANT